MRDQFMEFTESRRRNLLTNRVTWAIAGSVALSVALSLYFIAKSEIVVDHRRAFILFDDAAISLVYARNLAHGHGLTWTYGAHPVEGYTNFLWTLWMSVLQLTHLADRTIGLLVEVSGAVLLAVNTFLVARITSLITKGSAIATVVVGVLSASFYGLTLWTLQGMETGLVACLYSLAVLLVLRLKDSATARQQSRWWLILGVTFGAAGLTRDDCLVIVGVIALYAWYTLRPTWRQMLFVTIPAGVAIVGHELWRLVYYGYPFPNTYYLKLDGIGLISRWERGSVEISQNLTLQLVVPMSLVLTYLFVSRRHHRRVTPGIPLLLSIVAAQGAYVVFVGGDTYDHTYWDRYLVPVIPLLIATSVVALGALAQRKDSARHTFGAAAIVVAIGTVINWAVILPTRQIQIAPVSHWQVTRWIVVGFACSLALVLLGDVVRRGIATASRTLLLAGLAMALSLGYVPWTQPQSSSYNYLAFDALVAKIGVALRYATPLNATEAFSAAGNETFFSHRSVIDLLGYSDHFIATTTPHHVPYLLPGHNKWDYAYSIKKLRPNVVVSLFRPSTRDITNMAAWGYSSSNFGLVGTIYYLPGWFDPQSFAKHIGTLVPPPHEYVKVHSPTATK